MTPTIICFAIAAIFFVLDGFEVKRVGTSWTPLGFTAVVIGWIVAAAQ